MSAVPLFSVQREEEEKRQRKKWPNLKKEFKKKSNTGAELIVHIERNEIQLYMCRSNSGETALHLAAFYRENDGETVASEIIKLAKRQAEQNEENKKFVDIACINDYEGLTALHVAILKDNLGVVEAILNSESVEGQPRIFGDSKDPLTSGASLPDSESNNQNEENFYNYVRKNDSINSDYGASRSRPSSNSCCEGIFSNVPKLHNRQTLAGRKRCINMPAIGAKFKDNSHEALLGLLVGELPLTIAACRLAVTHYNVADEIRIDKKGSTSTQYTSTDGERNHPLSGDTQVKCVYAATKEDTPPATVSHQTLSLDMEQLRIDKSMCISRLQILKKLLGKVHPLQVNSQGNNVFHELIILSTKQWARKLQKKSTDEEIQSDPSTIENGAEGKEDPFIQNVKAVFEFILKDIVDKGKVKLTAGQPVGEKEILCLPDAKLAIDGDHFDCSYRYIPLETAAMFGAVEMFEWLLYLSGAHKSETTDENLIASHANHRLTPLRIQDHSSEEIVLEERTDELFVKRDETLSLMELITLNKGHKASKLLETAPIGSVIEENWNNGIGRVHFAFTILHTLMLLAMSAFAISRPAFDSFDGLNKTRILSYNTTQIYKTDADLFRLFLEIIIYLYAISLFFFELFANPPLRPFCKYLYCTKYIFLLRENAMNELHSLLILFWCWLIICSLLLRVIYYQLEEIALACAVVVGWWSLFHSLRPFKYSSFCTVTIQRVGTLQRFSIVLLIHLGGFSIALFLLFQSSDSHPVDRFQTFPDTFFTLFEMLIGIGDINVYELAYFPSIVALFFVFYFIISYVILFKMITAMLSESVHLVKEDKLLQWRLQRLHIIIYWKKHFRIFSLLKKSRCSRKRNTPMDDET